MLSRRRARRVLLAADDDGAIGEAEGGFDGLGEALTTPPVSFQDDAVDDGVDVVLVVAAEAERILGRVLEDFAEVHDLAVDAGALPALALEVFQGLAVEALLCADDGREDHEARAIGPRHDLV